MISPTLSPIAPYLTGADHTDTKIVESSHDMPTFIARCLNFRPWWVIALFGVRAVFVRLLGMRQGRPTHIPTYTPDTVPMIPGRPALFFTVEDAQPDQYWLAAVKDTHLNGGVAIIAEPLTEDQTRYHVVTIVHYKHWTGPVYFNVIRPFHHIVVGSMARRAARS